MVCARRVVCAYVMPLRLQAVRYYIYLGGGAGYSISKVNLFVYYWCCASMRYIIGFMLVLFLMVCMKNLDYILRLCLCYRLLW
jgi:hypothetical protein